MVVCSSDAKRKPARVQDDNALGLLAGQIETFAFCHVDCGIADNYRDMLTVSEPLHVYKGE